MWALSKTADCRKKAKCHEQYVCAHYMIIIGLQ